MSGPRDLFFYHYTKKEIALEKILSSQKLLFGSVRSSNDPWEYEKRYFQTIRDVEGRASSEKDIPDVLAKIDAYIKSHSRVLCFSIDDWQKKHDRLWRAGFCKPRMWAQYGDNHAGVCVVTSVGRTDGYASRYFRRPHLIVRRAKVVYQDSIDIDDALMVQIRNLSGLYDYTPHDKVETAAEFYAEEKVLQYAKALFFTKHKDWSDEDEYRILSWTDLIDDFYLNISFALPEIIQGIVLGSKFPDCYLQIVKACGLGWAIPVYRLQYFNGKPLLQKIHEVADHDFTYHVKQLEEDPEYMPMYEIT